MLYMRRLRLFVFDVRSSGFLIGCADLRNLIYNHLWAADVPVCPIGGAPTRRESSRFIEAQAVQGTCSYNNIRNKFSVLQKSYRAEMKKIGRQADVRSLHATA